ncbi:acyl carrier protein [Streptomyces sp. NPDC046712]|uniref:acyl carrier protein n=1 Tax=Streptomyces sp. NPDC046712 TaxID=3154802 RepID=UPI0033C7CFA3
MTATPHSTATTGRPVLGDTLTEQEAVARISGLLAQLLELAPGDVDPEVPVSAYGIDSANSTLLAHEVERWCGVPLDREVLLGNPTVSEIATEVVSRSRPALS